MERISNTEIVVTKSDTVKSIMKAVRFIKKQCRRRPYTYTITAPDMESIATAVMAAGLLGDARNWIIENVPTGDGDGHVHTNVSFTFVGNLPETHEQAQCHIGGRDDYEELEMRVKEGHLPSCWYISNLNGTRTLDGSISACIKRFKKSQARGENMHMGAAGSATRILFTMVAKAVELQTHVISEMTIHNGKRPINKGSNGITRDVTFVHIILQPVPSHDDMPALAEHEYSDGSRFRLLGTDTQSNSSSTSSDTLRLRFAD
tara:strand:+ start:1146 stop:1928 length:783 start_codon:yes stop_codon:yes gene_type:complete